jgi:hypothetical protein
VEETMQADDERPGRRCDACAEGRHCERLQQLVEAAWRHGETAANG